ncbi:MAG: hypothetical protein ACNA70_09470, partial [Brevefilum sp.]
LKSGEWWSVINCPIIPLVRGGRTINPEALPALLEYAEGLLFEYVSAQGGFLHYVNCFPLEALEEADLPYVFRRLRNHLQGVKNALMIAYERYFGANDEAITRMILLPALPDIRLTDQDAERIHFFLLRADQHARELFVHLMEQWVDRGYIVSTTPTSIVLDARYGEHGDQVRLAILHSGQSQNVADFFEDENYEAIPPAIILRWDSLRKQEGIPTDAFTAYQQAVEKCLTLRLTASSAHVQGVLTLDLAAMDHLVEAMGALVRRIDHGAVTPKVRAPRSTPSRVKSTLDLCDPFVRNLFDRMVTSWRAAGGIVQCTKIGRIYLKLQTRDHKSGNLARRARRFNMLTLVCPGQGKPAAIQVAWGLADADHPAAYLDCIPDAVKSFEDAVSGLPGFERMGSVARLNIDESFTGEAMFELLMAVYRLKAEEKTSP